jgi:hypothetical protein
MKTFADLKIGDPVWMLHAASHIEKVSVEELRSGNAIPVVFSGYNKYIKVPWNNIKDLTSSETDYYKVYCNMSEALEALKESYKDAIDKQWGKVQEAMDELIRLKNAVYKYL